MDFEWDADKEQSNQRKHGISFLEAGTVFGDPMELTIYNPDHSERVPFPEYGSSVERTFACGFLHRTRGKPDPNYQRTAGYCGRDEEI